MARLNPFRKRRRDPEIAPDEIFLDASNLPEFNKGRLEGSLEQPLSRGAYIGLGIAWRGAAAHRVRAVVALGDPRRREVRARVGAQHARAAGAVP